MSNSTNIINAKDIDLSPKTERSCISAEIKISLNCVFDYDEADSNMFSIIGKSINDYIKNEAYISINDSAIEKVIVDYLRQYSLNNEISSIQLTIETPLINSGNVTENVEKIIDNVEKKMPKVKATLDMKEANYVIMPKDGKKTETSVSEGLDNSSSPTESYLSAPPYNGLVISSSPPKLYISAIPQLNSSYQSVSVNSNFTPQPISGKDKVVVTCDSVSAVKDAFNHPTVNKMIPETVKLGSNKKIYTNSKFNGNGSVKIVGTVTKSGTGLVTKGAGIAGTIVSSGITLKEGYDKSKSATNNEGIGQAWGEAGGKIFGGVSGGSVGANVGASVGTTILIGTIILTGATITAPVAFTVIAGCALIGSVVGAKSGEAVGGTIGKNIGGLVGSITDKNKAKSSGRI